jgi:protein ImuA
MALLPPLQAPLAFDDAPVGTATGRGPDAPAEPGSLQPPPSAPPAAPPPASAQQDATDLLGPWLQARVWRGSELACAAGDGTPSGFAPLDAELPGGGWPKRALTELILPQAGIGEVRLLAPALAAVQHGERRRHGPGAPPGARPVMLFDPPAHLCAQALQALGLDLSELLVVQARTPALPGTDSLWALEQALRSGHVGAVVAWLPPRLAPERLRRLQLAAASHDGPAFVLREWTAQHRPSASPLRLALQPGGADALRVRLLKRRGPPLESPLQLALPPVLSPLAARRARRGLAGLPQPAGLGIGPAPGTPPSAGTAGGLRPHAPGPRPMQPLAGATFVQLG